MDLEFYSDIGTTIFLIGIICLCLYIFKGAALSRNKKITLYGVFILMIISGAAIVFSTDKKIINATIATESDLVQPELIGNISQLKNSNETIWKIDDPQAQTQVWISSSPQVIQVKKYGNIPPGLPEKWIQISKSISPSTQNYPVLWRNCAKSNTTAMLLYVVKYNSAISPIFYVL